MKLDQLYEGSGRIRTRTYPMSQLALEEESFRVGSKVEVPAASHDAYGEEGVIEKIDGDYAIVKFKDYTDRVQLRHLRKQSVVATKYQNTD